jgi:hypothetical protein
VQAKQSEMSAGEHDDQEAGTDRVGPGLDTRRVRGMETMLSALPRAWVAEVRSGTVPPLTSFAMASDDEPWDDQPAHGDRMALPRQEFTSLGDVPGIVAARNRKRGLDPCVVRRGNVMVDATSIKTGVPSAWA